MKFQMSMDLRPDDVFAPEAADGLVGKTTSLKTGGVVPEILATIVEAEVVMGVLLLTLDTDLDPFEFPVQVHLTAAP